MRQRADFRLNAIRAFSEANSMIFSHSGENTLTGAEPHGETVQTMQSQGYNVYLLCLQYCSDNVLQMRYPKIHFSSWFGKIVCPISESYHNTNTTRAKLNIVCHQS